MGESRKVLVCSFNLKSSACHLDFSFFKMVFKMTVNTENCIGDKTAFLISNQILHTK